MPERRERALDIASRARAEAVLAAHPSTVAWLTGYVADIETGPSPFALSPLALVAGGGPPTLVVSRDEEEAAAATGCAVVSYPGFGLGPMNPVEGAAEALERTVGGRMVATEPGALPASLAARVSWVDAAAELAAARAIKEPDEIEKLRRAIALCDTGQKEARARAAPGVSEIELWADVRAAIEVAAGGRTPLLADLVSGPRTEEIGGSPGERTLTEGELVLCDLVPRRDGYWGDSCATIALGEPNATARRKHRAVREALERTVEAVRPGLRAGDLDELARSGLDYPHHTGHGLGTAWHEEPRIVPGGKTVLEPGMVIALEPGAYADGEGVRVEQVVLIGEDGCEVLSGHELEL
ncbi:MAG TPA: Xaa-Pro peptidase family protein [Gaiellaceae bacterium]